MHGYDDYSDDYYINLNLTTEMDLQNGRESILHFFEQINKKYPQMRNFYCRDRTDFVLEEDKECGFYRWTSVEAKRVSSGFVNPTSIDEALEQHYYMLEVAPFTLSLSPLDCESLNLMLGFDYTYRGNHNQLIAEALGLAPAFEGLLEMPGATAIAYEPAIQFAVDEACRVQVRLSIESRTSAYHVRTSEYPEEQLSVYLTARRYGSLDRGESFVEVAQKLARLCREIAEEHVVNQILRPLQQAIAAR